MGMCIGATSISFEHFISIPGNENEGEIVNDTMTP